LRHDAGGAQDVDERRPDPLRDVRPPFFARDFGDLPARWKPLDLVQRERRRLRDEAFDREPPVLEAVRLKALEVIARRRDLVGERRIRDLAAAEFARQRVAGEEPLRGIRQRPAGSVDAAMIGRDQPEPIGDAPGDGEARHARSGCEPACDHRAPRDCAHSGPLVGAGAPVIIAMTRVPNPANQTIATWTTRNATSATVTRKCSVRADCRPPSSVTVDGSAETNAGDIARPVQMTSGKSTKITRM